MAVRSLLPALLAALTLGCAQEPALDRDCSAVDVSPAQDLPDLLSETGLYSEMSSDTLADAVIEFDPLFPLWTDGASKRRFLLLPEGGQVDTSDPDDWVFPVGTRFFKEFVRDDVRVETRMTLRTESGWAAATYLWSDDDAERVLDAATDVAGTPHDVPSAQECHACHGGRENFSLGFSQVQLDPDVRQDLADQGVLSSAGGAGPALDPVDHLGLGVLHANCSHCHNASRSEQPQATDCYAPGEHVEIDFTLPADLDSVDDAPVLRTGAEELGTAADSKVLDRMSRRDQDPDRPSMPPLGTEDVDHEGVAAVQAFLEAR